VGHFSSGHFLSGHYDSGHYGPSVADEAGLSKLYGCLYLGLYANIYVKPAF